MSDEILRIWVRVDDPQSGEPAQVYELGGVLDVQIDTEVDTEALIAPTWTRRMPVSPTFRLTARFTDFTRTIQPAARTVERPITTEEEAEADERDERG